MCECEVTGPGSASGRAFSPTQESSFSFKSVGHESGSADGARPSVTA